ncbi:phospholipid phosphatase-related protein type 5-like isoform X2 [Limanda limanda]|uniref:phospholipid phosphatase-related protein type 5-like isoform X2 n=1 Tax=Limanda limanda TaxID=27771 RepID=UPI0029C82F0D|nr:phospholipid phosphatase-related protein type 5-like isoform X2 [Limanda limanda]
MDIHASSEELVPESCCLPRRVTRCERRERVGGSVRGYLTPVLTVRPALHTAAAAAASCFLLFQQSRHTQLPSLHRHRFTIRIHRYYCESKVAAAVVLCKGAIFELRCHLSSYWMIDSQLSAQRRAMMRNIPDEDQGLQKTSTYIVPCFLLVELVIMAGTVLLAYYFEYTDTFPVHVQGFFCFDKAYSKPFPGPEDDSKAPPVLVYSLVTAIPTVTILIGEVTSFFVKAEGAQEKTIVTADCCYFNPLLRRIVRFLGVYSFGLFTTTIFANAGQVVTGNQTPHFLSACRPNYTALGCQSPLQYIAERRACTGNPYLVASARKSFPSKDAALSFYSAIYTVMYVTLVFRTKGTRLTKPTLCLVLLSLAVLVGVVRVTEHRNHWNDVVAGFVTGGAIAAFLVSCVINNFQQTQIGTPTPPPPQRPLEPCVGIPLLSLPRVESPLEKLQGYRILRSHDHQPIPSPTPPDVLLPSRRCLTSAV